MNRLFERERGRLKATARARALFEEVERSFQALSRVVERAQALERIGERRWRLVIPWPQSESNLDLIELIPAA